MLAGDIADPEQAADESWHTEIRCVRDICLLDLRRSTEALQRKGRAVLLYNADRRRWREEVGALLETLL